LSGVITEDALSPRLGGPIANSVCAPYEATGVKAASRWRYSASKRANSSAISRTSERLPRVINWLGLPVGRRSSKERKPPGCRWPLVKRVSRYEASTGKDAGSRPIR